jgi:predicted dehydrogenase
LLHQSHEDVMIGLIDYPDQVLAVLNINWTSPVKRRQLRVYGQKGMFSVNYITQDLYLYENPSPQEQEWGGPLGIEEGNMIKFHLARQEPLVREIDYFLHAVRTGVDLQEANLSGLQALHLSQLLVQSARTRVAVSVL